jgi:hypothetical protein
MAFGLGVALLLGGCQQAGTRQAAPEAAAAAAPGTAAPAQVAQAPGCAGEIARFRSVMASDLATGHVGKAVHDRVVREIDRASSACRSGMDTEAMAILRLTKAQNGYS